MNYKDYQTTDNICDMLSVIPANDVQQILMQAYGYTEEFASASIRRAELTNTIVDRLKHNGKVRLHYSDLNGRVTLHLEGDEVWVSSGLCISQADYVGKVGKITDLDSIGIYAGDGTTIIEERARL